MIIIHVCMYTLHCYKLTCGFKEIYTPEISTVNSSLASLTFYLFHTHAAHGALGRVGGGGGGVGEIQVILSDHSCHMEHGCGLICLVCIYLLNSYLFMKLLPYVLVIRI